MKAMIQKKARDEVSCSGCIFSANNDGCEHIRANEWLDCVKHRCIYVLADVEPVNKEGE